jgi:hypothetical protein
MMRKFILKLDEHKNFKYTFGKRLSRLSLFFSSGVGF